MAVLRYPYNAITSTTDYLQLDIIEYEKIGGRLVSNRGFRNIGKSSTTKVGDSILLPMPSNIQDGNSVKFADDSLNGIIASATSKVQSGMTANLFDESGQKQAVESFRGLVNGVFGQTKEGQATRELINRSLAAQAVNIFGGNVTPDQILARQSGEIFNPNMELLFNGVTLRAFKFSFKMTPRNKKESDQVKSIIRSLKQNMAPKTGSSDYFLKTPNVFELRYKKGSEDHPFLHRFKQCALTDISVNYTGENVYATYTDATPVSMIMDLTFRELEPIYNPDYNEGIGKDGVGY